MAQFTISDPRSHTSEPRVYEGPFGPVEIHQTKMPDLAFTLEGPNVPRCTLDLGPYKWLPRRVIKTRTREPFVALVGDGPVTIRNGRRLCLAAIRDPKLVAEGSDRRYAMLLKQFGRWTVVGADGSVRAAVRKEQWIDDSSDAFDVAVILLLRSLGTVYANLANAGAAGAAATTGG